MLNDPPPQALENAGSVTAVPSEYTQTPFGSPVITATPSAKKGSQFWLIFISINVSLFLAALELTAVSNALPTIADALQVTQFAWVGSAFALSSTAFLPMSGGLAQVFGRRPTLLLSLGLFTLGSGICGGANSEAMLFAGRTIQGMGGGGIQSLAYIVLGDLVSLQERGVYAGVFGLTWSLASVVGPLVGGSLASSGQWRWLFYLNLPIAGIAAAAVFAFLKLPTPPGTFMQKVQRLDWIGNVLVIGSSTLVTIALTWGGVVAPWTSAEVLVPLVIGLVGLCAFMYYEARWATEPLVPITLVTNCTSISGYIQTFLLGIVSLCLVYYLPVFYQGCKDATAIKSGIIGLGMATLAPAAIVCGFSVNLSKVYRPQIWMGWSILLVGVGLLLRLQASTPISESVGYLVVVGIGLGFLFAATLFPVLAPLQVSQNAPALAFLLFLRSFAGVWGVTIGSTVIQNQLSSRLPPSFIAQFPQGVSVAYALIPQVPTFNEPLKGQVQNAFSGSLKVLWEVMLGVSGAGMVISLGMKGLRLHTDVDEQWALKRGGNDGSGVGDNKDTEMGRMDDNGDGNGDEAAKADEKTNE